MFKCCLNTCKPFIEECNNSCISLKNNKQKNCQLTCVDIKNICKDNCMASSMWDKNNPIFIATKMSNCGSYYTNIDYKCLKKNKKSIIKNCKSNCIPTSIIDCSKYCNFSYDILNKQNIVKTSIPKQTKRLYNNNLFWVSIITSLIICLIFFLYKIIK